MNAVHSDDLLADFLELVRRWSGSFALVSTGDLAVLHRHIADARALLPHLPTHSTTIIDVGAGAGFPGVVLAVERPDARLVLLEPNHKKWAFLRTVKRELGLANLEPHAERDEEHLARPDFSPYEVAVSRATFPLTEWLRRGRRLVRPGGIVLAMEGRPETDLPPGAVRHPYDLEGRQRAIVVQSVSSRP